MGIIDAQYKRIKLTARDKRLIQQQHFTATTPGSIVHDFDALLDYVYAHPLPVTAMQQLPLRLLPEISALHWGRYNRPCAPTSRSGNHFCRCPPKRPCATASIFSKSRWGRTCGGEWRCRRHPRWMNWRSSSWMSTRSTATTCIAFPIKTGMASCATSTIRIWKKPPGQV